MKVKEHGMIEFECSGREMYANLQIIGINPELEVSGGYDQSSIDSWYSDSADENEAATGEERAELADYMIGLWTKYKDQP